VDDSQQLRTFKSVNDKLATTSAINSSSKSRTVWPAAFGTATRLPASAAMSSSLCWWISARMRMRAQLRRPQIDSAVACIDRLAIGPPLLHVSSHAWTGNPGVLKGATYRLKTETSPRARGPNRGQW
jgi:hypothetical protein